MISSRLSWLEKAGGEFGKNQGRMGRHIFEHPDWSLGKSYFVDIAEAKKVLKAFHGGKTTILKQVNNNTVIVKYTEATGYFRNKIMIKAGKPAETSHIFKLEGTNSVKIFALNPLQY